MRNLPINIFQSVVRLYFDLLHGIKRMDISLMMALEFAIFLGFDGQLSQNSDMEKELFTSAIDQLKERFNSSSLHFCHISLNLFNEKVKITKLENALVWLYVKTWGKFGDHVIQEKGLWNFADDDLERVIMSLSFPRKRGRRPNELRL